MNRSGAVGRLGRFRLINTLFSADDQWSTARDTSTNRWTDLFRPFCVHQALAPPLGKEVGVRQRREDQKGGKGGVEEGETSRNQGSKRW